ncbi:unnamed protein product [Caenorhabditis bovis]|uniref:Ubiquitinyl hydrolase 1 n=1 Tax=Caenorhabditis bovis TaxID=2654633 RepID=A0A8S1ESE3_9PELO|nr:unnamed protein product [Caenorhabditis bovis]
MCKFQTCSDCTLFSNIAIIQNNDGFAPERGDASSPAASGAEIDDMPAGASAARSPIGGTSESGDEGPRKRSASPNSSNLINWDNPAKKMCTDGVNVNEWIHDQQQTETNPINTNEMTTAYKENHEMLEQMGFVVEEIDLALRLSSNDVEKAIQYLTREISGLDSNKTNTSTIDARALFNMNDIIQNQYVESDEEDVSDSESCVWRDEDCRRVKTIVDMNRNIFYRKNGSFSRCLTVCKNILTRKTKDWKECLEFVETVVVYAINRHVNPPEYQKVYLGEQEIMLIEELYHAVIPIMSLRMTYNPVTIRTILSIEEMFNPRNKFFTSSAPYFARSERVYPNTNWVVPELVESPDNKLLFASLADEYIQNIIPLYNRRFLEDEDVPVNDIMLLIRSLAPFVPIFDRRNEQLRTCVRAWTNVALGRLRTMTDKEIRDSLTRRHACDMIGESINICDKLDFDIVETTMEPRMEFLKKCLNCPQMECMMFALEELGNMSNHIYHYSTVTFRDLDSISEPRFKQWLIDNKVLQMILTGNMDSAVYVERTQPILHYMTPELTEDDLKFIWSLRKGRMGVSVENFNKIMDLIVKGLTIEQMKWVFDLFRKSFNNRETRLYESIFNFCYIMVARDRNDSCKLMVARTIWELIEFCRGPPLIVPFKCIEFGMKKHCDILNSLDDKESRDLFLVKAIEMLKADATFSETYVVYLHIMLDKLKKMYIPRRITIADRCDEDFLKIERLRERLKIGNLFEQLMDRLEYVRKVAHENFESASLNSLMASSQESLSNAVFESTLDEFDGISQSILTSTFINGIDYGFVLDATLKLMRWLIESEVTGLTTEFLERLFNMFIYKSDSKSDEKAKIFNLLSELKLQTVRQDSSRSILSLFCKIDVAAVQIDGLRCFKRYFEDIEIMPNEEDTPLIESHIMERMNECKLFLWKLILLNDSDEVVDKSIEAFCEREIVAVTSPSSIRMNTRHFLSVFAYYIEQIKKELYSRSGKEIPEDTYQKKDIEICEEEIAQHAIPVEKMLTETLMRALDRLIRFLFTFVQLGNDKNPMIRQYPRHSASLSGHVVTFSLELRSDDMEDIDNLEWKRVVCDSNSTIGELKVRIARRLIYHENFVDFSLLKRMDDSSLPDSNCRYDNLTLKECHFASESDSILASEKSVILIKPRRSHGRRQDSRRATRESYLPSYIVSKYNFYDLIHELVTIGDTRLRSSCRRLLLLLPTQPAFLEKLQLTEDEKDQDVSLVEKFNNFCNENLNELMPNRTLYALEAISSIVAPTVMTVASTRKASELISAMHETDVFYKFATKVLQSPNIVPTTRIPQNDRHSIFERIIQIFRAVYTGRSSLTKAISNEKLVRREMFRIADQMTASRQSARPIDNDVGFVLLNLPLQPSTNEIYGIREIETLECCSVEVLNTRVHSFGKISSWSVYELQEMLNTLRNFIWIHAATDSIASVPIVAVHEDEANGNSGNREKSASEIIQGAKINLPIPKGYTAAMPTETILCFRWLIIRKVLSIIRLLVKHWIANCDNTGLLCLLAHLFLEKSWRQFYKDILVNCHKQFRDYMQRAIVKISKYNPNILHMVLKMLFELYYELPMFEGKTEDLTPLEKRQRLQSENIVFAIHDCLPTDKPTTLKKINVLAMCDYDWSSIGFVPITILTDAIRSLTVYQPRFSEVRREYNRIEETFAFTRMKLITAVIPFCTQAQIENCGTTFLDTIMNKFLFPPLPDVEQGMIEDITYRWENNCRDIAIQAVNYFCERSFKLMNQVFDMMHLFPMFHKMVDSSYRPLIRPREYDQVGLKNDGGTCYMNATLQQLVHVPGLAAKIISIKGIDPTLKWGDNTTALFTELQKVFAQLVFSKAQACIPCGMWKEFRFEPDVPLNTKQHHDAIDFYSILLDKCDEVIKKLKLPQMFQEKFYGKYSYEKICYGCWHRYKSPDEEFNCISLALHGDNLQEAIENFLDAHVMEGENAYYCQECNEKKTTLNRTSFLELPSTMTIQLKRFTYDVINNMIKKDNQIFQFPFEIDMQPYMTASRHVPDDQVQALFDDVLYVCNDPSTPPPSNGDCEPLKTAASSSNLLESPQKKLFRRHRSSTLRLSQSVAAASSNDLASKDAPKPMIYELVGVLAHSGIATAGHYYSFVKERREEFKDSCSYGNWYHINDTQTQPMNMDTHEDLWFGGHMNPEIMNEERIRHWNAYVLFYELKNDDTEKENDKLNGSGDGPRPKVTFQCSDVEIKHPVDDELTSALKLFDEAKKLRLEMFHSMDPNLQEFLNEEHARYLKERDYYSTDVYYLFVMSCYRLLRGVQVDFTLETVTREAFMYHAFVKCFSYISRICWQMFDEHRPKGYPRSTIELLKILMNENRRNKTVLMANLVRNDMEVFTRLVEVNEHDARHAFWVVVRFAFRHWVLENGDPPSSQGSVKMVASRDSTDVEDDDEEEDEDDEDDIDDEEIESDIEGALEVPITKAIRPIIRINPIVPPVVPVEPYIDKRTTDDVICEELTNDQSLMKKIICKIVQLLSFQCDPMVRFEFGGRHFTRHSVDIMQMIARANSFGANFLLSCNVLECATDLFIEDCQTPFARLRFSEARMKANGLWPTLPWLFFELLNVFLERVRAPTLDARLVPRNALNLLIIYCSAREEAENVAKMPDDRKLLHARIIECFYQQIVILMCSEREEDVHEYIVQLVQTVLKEMTMSGGCFGENTWPYLITFFCDLAQRLHSLENVDLALKILEELLYVPVAEDETMVHPGLLPQMRKWLQFRGSHKTKKMFEALFYLRKSKNEDIADTFRTKFKELFDASDDEDGNEQDRASLEMIRLADDGERRSPPIIGPQPLRRASNTTNLTAETEPAIATARIIETRAIDLKKHIQSDRND